MSKAASRIDSRHTHGTGCTLASAIAVKTAQGHDLPTSITMARAYVREAIRTAPGYGAGHGPMNHGHPFGEGEIVVVQDMLACRLTRMAEAIDMRGESDR